MPIRLDYDWDHRLPIKSLPQASHYPVISNVAVTAAGLVTWTTDVASTSQVLYGTTPNLGVITAHDSTLVTSHSVQLTGLTDGTRYYLKVQSFYIDSLSISDIYTFIYTSVGLGHFLLEDGSSFILLEDGSSRLDLEA